MIGAVAGHEWRVLRSGMTFWVLLAFVQLIVAWLAFRQLEVFMAIAPQLKATASTLGTMDLVIAPTLNSLVLVMLIAMPLLAAGSLAGEVRSGRVELWLSAPVPDASIVLGKALGLWLGGLALLAGPCLTLAAVGLGVELDWPRFALALGFLLLFSLWLVSVVLMLSALVEHPAAALAAAYGLLFFLWLLDSFGSTDAPWYWAALLPHVKPWFLGLLRSQDLVYFGATTAAALLVATYRLARRRGAV